MTMSMKEQEHDRDCVEAAYEYSKQEHPKKIILKALEFYRLYGLEVMVKRDEVCEPGPGPLKPSPGGVVVKGCPYATERNTCTIETGVCIVNKGNGCNCTCKPDGKKKKKQP